MADRLRDLEDANDQLGSLDPAAADDMDWEVRRMRSEMDRLYSENWRHVVPSLDVITQDIEYAGDDMEASLDDE